MEWLLNEKSLDGQFDTIEDFYETLPVMSRNLKILKEQNIQLLRHSSLYSRRITGNTTMLELSNQKGYVNPLYRDQIRKWKKELSSLVMTPPFWDVNTENACTSLEEAARRRTDVLSFFHPNYSDVTLQVHVQEQTIAVRSAVSTTFFVDLLWQRNEISLVEYLRNQYGKRILSFEHFETEIQSLDTLQKSELEEFLAAIARFDLGESWEVLRHDRFFNLKRYQPASKKQDYFATTKFADKEIYKFRCGQHSQVRCFGFRENEQFHAIMLERDHRISDTG